MTFLFSTKNEKPLSFPHAKSFFVAWCCHISSKANQLFTIDFPREYKKSFWYSLREIFGDMENEDHLK